MFGGDLQHIGRRERPAPAARRPAGVSPPVLAIILAAMAPAFGASCGPEPNVRAAPPPPPSAPPVASAPPPASASASANANATEASPPSSGDEVTPEDAERVLFLATHLRTDGLRKSCPPALERDARVRCLIALRYEEDTRSRDLALDLYKETGSLAGLLPEETSDDGHGRKVHLMPARPVGSYREHLEWILAALRDYARFREGIGAHGEVHFRDRPLHFRFFYSETGGHPSAFAVNRNVGYNLFGALNVSGEAVRDTLFHEIFHLNDAWHGDWSKAALAPIFDRITARCGKKTSCLAPHSPTDTRMGGTFYAFHPSGGVKEYAAELALRYYREHRLVLEKKPLPVAAFKCGPAENAEAWGLLAAEMFGGVDLVPACP